MRNDADILEERKLPLRFREQFIQHFSDDLFRKFVERCVRSRTFTIQHVADALDITRADAKSIIAFGVKEGVIDKYHSYWKVDRKLGYAFIRALGYSDNKAYKEANPQEMDQDEEEKKPEERSDDYPASDETYEEYENRLRKSLREDMEEDAWE